MSRPTLIVTAAVSAALVYVAGIGQNNPKLTLADGSIARSIELAERSGHEIVKIEESGGWPKLLFFIAAATGFGVSHALSNQIEDEEQYAIAQNTQLLLQNAEAAELQKNYELQLQAQRLNASLRANQPVAELDAEMEVGGYQEAMGAMAGRSLTSQPTQANADSFGPPVQPAPVSERSPVSTAVNPLVPSEAGGKNKTALGEVLSSPFKSRAVFGSQRAGKSLFLAVAGKKLADKGVKIFQLNLLSYTTDTKDEDKIYTQHVYKSVRGDYSRMDSMADKNLLVSDAIAVINEWWSCEEPAILLFDEWFYASSKNLAKDPIGEVVTTLSDKLTAIASSGMKRTKAAWLLCPLMKAGSLSDDGKQIKNLDLLYVTIAPNSPVKWEGQAITWDDQLFAQVKTNFPHIWKPQPSEAPGESRISFTGDRWLPTGITPSMLSIPNREPVGNNLAPVKVKPTIERVKVMRSSGMSLETIVNELWNVQRSQDGWLEAIEELTKLLEK